jgi:prepilin-type N-terminal cleavage/methylation domain-containing protein
MARPPRHPAFSLLELVIVLVIMGVVAAIAIPRMSSSAENAKAGSLRADLDQLQRSIELYAAEHGDRGPEMNSDGSVVANPRAIATRLMRPTNEAGTPAAAAPLGPYLRLWPRNPYNGRYTIRLDGPPAGANVAGWRFDSASRTIEADHSVGATNDSPGGPVDVDTMESSG